MIWIVVVVVGALILLAIWGLVSIAAKRPSRGGAGADDVAASRPRPAVAEFHVRGAEALVTFDVPLPEGEPDQVLTDLLTHEAVEVVREKRHDLPIDHVTHVVALGRRNGEPAEVGRVTLSTPGELPPPAPPEMAIHASRLTFDPLAEFHAADLGTHPGVAAKQPGETLRPLGEELRLARSVEAGLRAQGLDPTQLSAGDLALGLLRQAGYVIVDHAKPGTFVASKGGQRTYVRVVDHERGSYPELDSRIVAEFVADFVGSGSDRGLLVTEKFGPFEVYERERREPRVRFVTRERLQRFVDTYAVS